MPKNEIGKTLNRTLYYSPLDATSEPNVRKKFLALSKEKFLELWAKYEQLKKIPSPDSKKFRDQILLAESDKMRAQMLLDYLYKNKHGGTFYNVLKEFMDKEIIPMNGIYASAISSDESKEAKSLSIDEDGDEDEASTRRSSWCCCRRR